MAFVRPLNLKFPQIYGTFRAKDNDSEDEVDFIIQDLPVTYFEKALDLLIETFIQDEILYKSRGLSNDEEVVDEVRKMFREKLERKISIACFKDGSDDLVGLYVFSVFTDGDAPDEGKTEAFKDIIDAHNFLWEKRDTMTTYETDKFLTDYALVVSRDYRQRGIAGEFLKARIALTKLLGIKVTSSIFTSSTSQKAAEKIGFKVGFEIDFNEFAENFPQFDLSGVKSESIKILDYIVE